MTDPDAFPASFVPADFEAKVDGALQREPLPRTAQDYRNAEGDDDGYLDFSKPRIVKQPENPKAAAGRQKLEYANTPPLPALYQAAVHDLGAQKYGSYNWRDRPIKISDYISALRRHLADLEAGVDVDEESGLPHLAHVMATAAIVIDASAAGTLIDDRRHTPSLPAEMKRIAELKKGWPRAA